MSRPRRSAEDRFQEKTLPAASGCIEWSGSLTGTGYGTFYAGPGQYVMAHRWSFERQNGPIPKGLHLDHLCRNRRCVNADHLEPVTPRENLMRGETVNAKHAAATHCPAGHPYSGYNLYVVPRNGNRMCRTCINRRSLARYYRLKG